MNQQTPILVNVLAGLLRQRGIGLLDDRRRTLGLLRDKVPNEGRAIRILMTAFDQGVPARLSRGPVSQLDIGREVALLSDETGISLDRAREAVETWAVAIAPSETPPTLAAAPAQSVEALPPVPIPAPALAMVQPLPPAPTPSPIPAPAAMVQPLPPAPTQPPIPAPAAAMVQPLPPAPIPPEIPAPAPAMVQPLPPIAPPAPAAVPLQAATHGAVEAAPSPSRSPRAQPVTVRQVLKGPSRPAAAPLRDALPATGPDSADRPEAPRDAAAPLGAEPSPVQPLPVQPLPVQPLPVQPLPVRRSTAAAFEQPAPRRPETAPVAAPPKGGRLQRWAGIIVGILALVSGLAKLTGAVSSGGRSAPPPVDAAPVAEAAPPTTAEGIVIMSPSSWPTYRFERIKDDPTTLVFYFGIPYKGQSYTYYSAVALDDGKTTGSSILILIRDKQQMSSGAFPIELRSASKEQYFTESVGKVPNKYGAPNLCVFINFAPKVDRLDPIPSGAAGVYGVDAKGGCDMNVSFGHANLKQ